MSEDCRSLGIFILPSIMNDVAGVNDDVGSWIERVDVGDRAFEIAYSAIGVGRYQRNVGVGNLRDDHDAGCRPGDRRLA